jgi:hypothetical protein
MGTFAALLLVFAAFDDITTDNATTSRVEYTFLVACSAWLAFVAVRLLRAGHRLLGGTSLVALATGVWAQRAIGPGIVPGFWTEYVAASVAYLWFVALALGLIWRGWRHRPNDTRVMA